MEILQLGVDVNAVNAETGVTALFIAAESGRADVVAIPIEHGADANVEGTFSDFEDCTPLLIAATTSKDATLRRGCGRHDYRRHLLRSMAMT